MKYKKRTSIFLSAAFLMATSAVGPGFLTQTASFTSKLAASFGFVILVSVIIDIFAQLNIWRVLGVAGMRAQDVANKTFNGSGYLLAALIVLGGLVFNIGNIAGAGLGLNVLTGLDPRYGAVISAAFAIGIFSFKDAAKAMDVFIKIMGFVMIALIVWVVVLSQPPIGEALYRTVYPAKIEPVMIITIVGGTVGGYITFAGAHRLIDAGLRGTESLPEINRAAISGILITSLIRYLLFLAAFGVVALGLTIDSGNPAASVFENVAGVIGYKIFGVIMWSAAITSVIGAAYTSVSFLKTISRKVESHIRITTILFILFSTVFFAIIGQPVKLLIFAGTFNGFILPIGLALILIASRKTKIVGDFRNSNWLLIPGWLIVVLMGVFSVQSLITNIPTMFGK
ncbi:MAG: NRAMP family divalent metal transporter [Pyrinomonadaceae bacterium]